MFSSIKHNCEVTIESAQFFYLTLPIVLYLDIF